MAAIIQWRRLWAGDPFKSEPGDCIRVSAPAKNFRMARILRSNSFHGTQFFTKNLTTGEELQVIYSTKNLKNVITAVQNVADKHGFGPVDPTELLLSVLGIGNSVVHVPGPVFEVLKSYPVVGYDWEKRFLSRDRSFVRSLLEVVFCQESLLPHGWKAMKLKEVLASVEFDGRVNKREAESYHLTGLHYDDSMSVIISGEGNEPNSFHFRHTPYWVDRRLLAPSNAIPRQLETRVD